ncbi:MAG: hypothetical protein LBS86_05085 [Treponema sp.]|jgi:hypothetical protein|nr:hypothetical protein [Treponema sp.]
MTVFSGETLLYPVAELVEATCMTGVFCQGGCFDRRLVYFDKLSNRFSSHSSRFDGASTSKC